MTPAERAEFEKLLLKNKAGITTKDSDRIIASDDTSPAPLSFAQKRLWYLSRLDPGSSAYNLFGGSRIQGDLDIPALEKSVLEVTKRHESLRTTFRLQDKVPVQIIHEVDSFSVEQIDLTAESESQRTQMLREVAEHVFRRPFDLAEWPLFRIVLVRTGEKEHTAIMAIHHIISDAWSMGILINEMGLLYAAYSNQERPQLPKLDVQYKDFARWQDRWLQTPEFNEQLGYWQKKLGGELAQLSLPTDFSRPQFQTTSGTFVEMTLDLDSVGRIRQLAQEQHASVYMLLLAVFKLLLHRLSGQTDIIVGSPIAGRHRPEIENLIGFFINTIVMRSDFSGNPSFLALLKQVRQTVLDAFSNQDLPFEKIVEVLSPERDLSRTPIFQVFFNHIKVASGNQNQGHMPLEGLETYHYQSKFDLTLYVFEDDKKIRLMLVYNDNLFKRQRMFEFLEQYQGLIQQILTQPDIVVKSLTLITESAAKILPAYDEQLAVQWSGHVLDRICQFAEQTPDKTAIEDNGGKISYRQLHQHITFLTQQFNSQGVTHGTTVAVIGNRSIKWTCTVLSVLNAGGVFCILDPNYPPQRLAQYINEITSPYLAVVQSNDDAIKNIVTQLRAIGSLEDITLLDCMTEPENNTSPVPTVEVPPRPDDLAYINFTSGTTGIPKAIGGSMRPISHFLSWYEHEFEVDSTDRFSMLSGLSHDPILRDLFAPFWLGATLCIPAPQDMLNPERLYEWMQTSHISVTHLTPAMGMLLSMSPNAENQVEQRPLIDLRYLFFGGDLLMSDHLRAIRKKAPNAKIVNFYGATETPQAMGFFRVPEHSSGENRHGSASPIPIGCGIAAVQLLVVNDAGNPCGIGELGEIWIRTPYLSKGYLNDGESTKHKFISNPFTTWQDDIIYKTGDLGRHGPDCNIEFVGRSDRQLKINGFRIEPGTIEHCLREHAAISDAHIMVKVYESGTKYLVAFIQTDDGNNLETGIIQQFIAEKLPPYMVPARIICMKALPLTPNRKIDLERLAEIMDGTSHKTIPTEPATKLERAIADVWRSALNIDSISTTDNFFEIGGHSLLSIEVIATIEKKLGVVLNPRDFVYQTLGQLVAGLEQRRTAPRQKLSQKGESGFLRRLKQKLTGNN